MEIFFPPTAVSTICGLAYGCFGCGQLASHIILARCVDR